MACIARRNPQLMSTEIPWSRENQSEVLQRTSLICTSHVLGWKVYVDIIEQGVYRLSEYLCTLQNGGQIKREKNIYHHCPKHIPIICHLPDPPSFSLPTTFKKNSVLISLKYINFLWRNEENSETINFNLGQETELFDFLTAKSRLITTGAKRNFSFRFFAKIIVTFLLELLAKIYDYTCRLFWGYLKSKT
jgi:hypothetical protein